MRVTLYHEGPNGEKTDEIADQFEVLFPVMELKLSTGGGIVFVDEHGREFNEIDLGTRDPAEDSWDAEEDELLKEEGNEADKTKE
jgi:hypothetical protein